MFLQSMFDLNVPDQLATPPIRRDPTPSVNYEATLGTSKRIN